MTRHNIGFLAVDRLAKVNTISVRIKRFKSLFGTGLIDSQQVVLVKPLTYMNRSGESVKRVADFFHLKIEDLIVIHDDLDLPFGRLRFRQRGGDGGHQGIRSVIERMGDHQFLRLKIGIGRPPAGMDPADYVLEIFDKDEQSQLDQVLSRAAEAVRVTLLDGLEKAMNQFQRNK
jgi:PTH1 family peptidyl-tRNA hydrolase